MVRAARRSEVDPALGARCAALIANTHWDTGAMKVSRLLLERPPVSPEVDALLQFQRAFLYFRCGDASYRNLLEEALESRMTHTIEFSTQHVFATILMEQGTLPEALRVVEELSARGHGAHHTMWILRSDWLRARLLVLMGRSADAAPVLNDVLARSVEGFGEEQRQPVWAWLALALAHCGQISLARTLVQREGVPLDAEEEGCLVYGLIGRVLEDRSVTRQVLSAITVDLSPVWRYQVDRLRRWLDDD